MRINEDIGEDSEDRLPFGSEEETVSKDEKYTYVVFKKSVMNMYEEEKDAVKLADTLNMLNVDPDEKYVVEKIEFNK